MRPIAALAAATLTAALALAAVPAATAAPLAQPPVRTFVFTELFNLDGFGSAQGWYHHYNLYEKVELAPKVAWYATDKAVYISNGKPQTGTTIEYLVNGRTYDEVNGAHTWTIQSHSAAWVRSQAQVSSPFYGLSGFFAIPGVTLVGTGHYRVTATDAAMKAFFVKYTGINYQAVILDNGFKAITIDLWYDTSGRPAKLLFTGKSSSVKMYLLYALTHYNQPLTINAPA